MSAPIEDYALIGNCETAALVSRHGSIDWLCLPHFDSPACFTKLVGDHDNGYWKIAPSEKFSVQRSYLDLTMTLKTTFTTDGGVVELFDSMIVGGEHPLLVRLIRGVSGKVEMHSEFVLRFDYGSIVPWVQRRKDNSRVAIAGPDMIILNCSFNLVGRDLKTLGHFTVSEGEEHFCQLHWLPSHESDQLDTIDVKSELEKTNKWWRSWISNCTYTGEFKDQVMRSLLTLKALTFAPTGGIVAAPTSSLPEELGSERNWDYRYCWLRDSTFTLYSLITTGFLKEAEDWRKWLVRAIAGTPSQVNNMYGIRGERRLTELSLDWLAGYEKSKPVRIGNAAFEQRQLDIFVELMDTLQLARRNGLAGFEAAWNIQRQMVNFVIENWQEPDEGIWEMRGGPKQFVHSKAMAWVAVDRGVRAAEEFKLKCEIDRWRGARDMIYQDLITNGYNAKTESFAQAYGSDEVDASLLMLPVLGVVDANDPRMKRTIEKIERELMHDGLLSRYRTHKTDDGLSGSEGKFLACTFWLVDYYVLAGKLDRARELFLRLLELQNDVGLLSEEFDPGAKRMLGNFPQALSHIALINSAVNLSNHARGSARDRSRRH
jgi:GH15 family glucan-1,4-alpha-glucosidase